MQLQENRLMDAILTYVQQEVQYRISNPLGSRNDLQLYDLKTEYYRDLLKHFKKDLNAQERASRSYLKNEIRKLSVKTKPGTLNSFMNGRVSRWLRNFVTRNATGIKSQEMIVQRHQNRVGLEKNMAQLTDAVKKTGFNQNIDHVLQKMINQGLPKFHIRYADIRYPNTDFILHFNHIPGSGAYQFEKFDVACRPAAGQAVIQPQQNWQTFSVDTGNNITAADAAHLVEGRAVCKNENSNQWIMLDRTGINGTFQNIQFDIKESLKELPLQKKGMQEFENLVRALRTGATKEVVLNIDGKQQPFRLVAAPHYQSVRILDTEGKLIDKDALLNNRELQMAKLEKIISTDKTKVVSMDFSKGIRG